MSQVPNRALPPLVGRKSTIDFFLGTVGCPKDAPLLCAAEEGFSPFGAANPDQDTRQLARWMRSTTDGAFVALIDAPPARRPMALLQSNRGDGTTPNFYERHHPHGGEVWRDFYYRTLFVLLEQIQERWQPGAIELSHPTGHGWSQHLLTVALEAFGHLADDRPLSFRRVHLSCCLDDLPRPVLDGAYATLNQEQAGADAPRHQPIPTTPVDPSAGGPPHYPGALIWHVEIPLRQPVGGQ